MASQPPPLPPLHRIMLLLGTLRRSQWLNRIHRRQRIRRLFWHIDRLLDYIRRHRILPATASNGQAHRWEEEDVELRRMHQQQVQVSLTRIRHYIRPLHQYLMCHQPVQLTSYHQCMNIPHIFTSQL